MSGTDGLHAHQRTILSDLERTRDPERRVQVEAWEDGPVAHLLVAAQGPTGAQAWIVRHDAVVEEWTGGCVSLGPCPSHHDRAAILAGIPLSPLTGPDMVALGILGGSGSLAQSAVAVAVPPQRPGLGVLSMRTGMGKSAMLEQMVGRLHRGRPGVVAPAELGFPSGSAGRLDGPPQGRRVAAPGSGTPPPGLVRIACAQGASPREEAVANAARLVAGTLSALAARLHPGIAPILGPATWTAPAHAFFSRPGRTGERRRQAGRLYPAFAPAIAAVPSVAAAVDAARPFESALCEALAPVRGAAPTVAALRRMRHLTRDAGFERIDEALQAAARLPVDRLPRGAAGWSPLLGMVGAVGGPADDLGLELADVVARDTIDGGPSTWIPASARATLEGAREMARRMRDTLVGPALRSRGREAPDAQALRISGAILFAGKGLPAIDALQRRWHVGLAALEARLPRDAFDHAWGAAFPPFDAGGGVTVTCLTDEAALRAEGGRGPDAEGIEGMDHCVGGFGRECHSGSSFVASIRRTGGPIVERLSTVEFERAADGSLAPVQHYGRRNRKPPDEAVAALAALLDALEEGEHPLADLGSLARDPGGFEDGYDWRRPGALERALSAWSPFLPRGIARDGVDALCVRADRAAEGLRPLTPPSQATPRIVVIRPEDVRELLRVRALRGIAEATHEADPRLGGP